MVRPYSLSPETGITPNPINHIPNEKHTKLVYHAIYLYTYMTIIITENPKTYTSRRHHIYIIINALKQQQKYYKKQIIKKPKIKKRIDTFNQNHIEILTLSDTSITPTEYKKCFPSKYN
jgi:hypothetical protein